MADGAAGSGEQADSGVDNEINLEQLKTLKQIFEAADDDGSGELDIDEFCAKLGPHLGVNLKPQQVAQLFMKIDADAGGTVDWDEFTNFMFLQKAQAAGDEGDADNWRLFPADLRDKTGSSSMHHEQVDKVYFCAAIDKYITCARDGTFRLWQASDLDYVKTVNNGSSWITDCMFLPHSRKMVFTTMDRAITYYDITRGSYDLIGRVYASGAMGVPLALHVLSGDAGERAVYGDSRGAAVLLLCGSRELPARDLISTETHKDYIYLHKEHSDWVTKVQWIPELGLVTSSLDATIKTFDINREHITHTCTHHTKGVHSFVWCHAYSCFASCGLERDVTVWHGTSGRKVGELRGHTSSVKHIAHDSNHNHIFTMSLDKSIKVWDLRNHRCLQTISQDDWVRQSDSSPTCFMYDSTRCRLVTACLKPYVWQHKAITQDRTGHKDPVRGALYNAAFAVIVSVDEAGTTCVWNLQDGAREGRFSADAGGMPGEAPDGAKASSDGDDNCPCANRSNCVTAISFDKNQRRLVMGTNSGAVTVWNFNNGSLLRRFSHDQGPLEVCEVLLAWDDKRCGDVVYAAGWNAKVFVWEDRDEDDVQSYKTLEGHRSDILAMTAYAPRQLLTTGDYQGKINIWGLFTGERKSSVAYRSQFAGGDNSWTGCASSSMGGGKADTGLYSGCGSSTVECSVECLLWVPAFSPQQRQAASDAAAALTASAAPLAAGSSLCIGVGGMDMSGAAAPDGCSPPTFRQPGQQQSAANVNAVSSSSSLLSDISLASMQQHKQQQQQQRQNPSTDQGSSTGSSPRDNAAEQQQQQQQPACVALGDGDDGGAAVEPDALLLLAAGGDGGVLVWQVDRLTQVTPLCTLPGAVGVCEVVTTAGLDASATVVVLGDSTGHLRVLDTSAGIDTSSEDAAAASFKQRAHWQAHDAAVASVDLIPARAALRVRSDDVGDTGSSQPGSSSSAGSSAPLILTSSRDCNVALWTLDGGLVGVLGEHAWDLDDPGTWQDPRGLHSRPPRCPEQQDDTQILGESTGSIAAGSTGSSGLGSNLGMRSKKAALLRASLAPSSRVTRAGAAAAQAVGSGTNFRAAPGASMPAHTGRSSPSKQAPAGRLQPPASAHPAAVQQLEGAALAALIMQDRKQKQREAMVTTTPQPHCQLRVHELADIAKAAGIGLKGGAESRQKQQHKAHSVVSSRHTGPGSRQLGSRNSGTGSSWSGWTGS